jgi:hypothetical protein
VADDDQISQVRALRERVDLVTARLAKYRGRTSDPGLMDLLDACDELLVEIGRAHIRAVPGTKP